MHNQFFSIFSSSPQLYYILLHALAQSQNLLKCLSAVFRCDNNGLKKKTHPMSQVIGLPHTCQSIIICATMLLQVRGQIERRFGK